MEPTYPDRIQIAHLPTRLERMERLSRHLGGPLLLIKRDDQTGLATGGNKTRKLEFLVADALKQGCDVLVTTGAPQSNHCRQTAAAAARLGLGCSLVLRGAAPNILNGNLLLDRLLGADLHWTGGRSVDELMAEVAEEIRGTGRKPYLIPLGGSNALGAVGYVLAMPELVKQLASNGLDIDCIICASSSAGTQAGILIGAEISGYSGRVLGISVDHPASKLKPQIAALAAATAAHLGLGGIDVGSRVEVNDDYIGQGYGIIGELEREAIRLTAQLEGILLDPVYTGRAMGGLIDLIRRGAFRSHETLLFWHTGGTPALFAYGDQLLER